MGITFNPFSGTLDFTGSGGGGTIAGSIANTQVAFGTGANTIGGDTNLTWNSTTNVLTIGTALANQVSIQGATTGIAPRFVVTGSDTDVSLAFGPQNGGSFIVYNGTVDPDNFDPNVTLLFQGFPFVTASNDIAEHVSYAAGTANYGGFITAHSRGTTTSPTAVSPGDIIGYFSSIVDVGAALGPNYTAATFYTYLSDTASPPTDSPGYWGFFVTPIGTLGISTQEIMRLGWTQSINSAIAGINIWLPDSSAYPGATNKYYFWADDNGVFRIRSDNTFNSVYQAIPALYNPQVTKYTPGATNFERVVLQWESNVAVVTTEKGGTGTLRALQLGDASVPVQVGGSVFRPTTSDAAALGSATLQWSDLFLAEGGVINWDNGDATLTQVGDVVTLAGAALANSAPGSAANSVATIDGTQTLTNKRITKRVVTAADATSITPNTDSADITYQANTQAAGTLTINADGGTPTNGQPWLLKIKSTNVQTFSWNAVYVGGTVALPTTTTGSSTIDNFAFLYDTVNSKWQFTGAATGY